MAHQDSVSKETDVGLDLAMFSSKARYIRLTSVVRATLSGPTSTILPCLTTRFYVAYVQSADSKAKFSIV